MFSVYDVVIDMDDGGITTFSASERPEVTWFDGYVRVTSPQRIVEVSRLTLVYVSVTERSVSAREIIEGVSR